MESVRAVERALDVLLAFDRVSPSLSVTDLQKRLDLSRPTLYRLLRALESRGLIRAVGEPQRFQLDGRVVALADAWLAQNDVVRAAEAVLKALRETIDETVALFVAASGPAKFCALELPSRQPLVFTRGAGFTEPLPIGSSGKAILAFMPEAMIASALAGLGDTARRASLTRELALIRADGHSISAGEIIAGALAIGVPIFDHAGDAAGSVCVFGPEARIRGDHRARCLAEARAAAARISAALGHRGTLPVRADAAE
ncbi:MAG: IclR family transcriptional regulator [Alphaproteobacteria bacterium]|nr:IclR family transcriptional regulator [Alphaproteobacteria bacterium]